MELSFLIWKEKRKENNRWKSKKLQFKWTKGNGKSTVSRLSPKRSDLERAGTALCQESRALLGKADRGSFAAKTRRLVTVGEDPGGLCGQLVQKVQTEGFSRLAGSGSGSGVL